MKNILNKIGLYFVAILFLIITGYPFVFVLFTSFKSQMEYMVNVWTIPKKLFLGNFQAVFQPHFLRYFLNSLIVSIISVTIILIIGSLASYAFAKLKFRLNKYLFILFLAGMMIPIHTTLIPIYVLINKMGLYNSLYGLIGPYVSINLPIAIIIMTQFFKEVPGEIEEAARIDGCSHFGIYSKIMLPLSTPAISTVAIYNFLHVWNEFIYALVLLDSPQKKTLSLGIREFYGLETVNIPGIITAILVGSLPVMVFYFLAQEKVINGLVSGSVKG
jgi:raffinose/stachyose/melibiose transport system permease protein